MTASPKYTEKTVNDAPFGRSAREPLEARTASSTRLKAPRPTDLGGPFVGRASELETLERWIASGARVVSVLGPPGAGKSRVLRRLASLHGAAVRDAEVALEEAERDIGATRAGRGVRVVVVDHADGADLAALVAALACAPDTCLVLASRARLGLPGETRLRIGPLTEEDAELLWRDRALSAGLDVPWSMVARESFDRYPLSIETLAEHDAGEGRRALPARVGELPRVAIALDALAAESPGLAQVLCECACFAAPFSAAAAAKLSVLGTSVERALALLADRSLLVRAGENLVVPDFLRAAAFARLPSGTRRDLFERHARHFIAAPDSEVELVAAFERLEATHADLAAEALLACDDMMPTRAATSGLLTRTEPLLGRMKNPRLRARLLLWRGFAQLIHGARADAKADLERARDAAAAHGFADLEARAYEALGLHTQWEGNFRGVEEILTSAKPGSEILRARNMGVLRLAQGDVSAAMTMLEASCAAALDVDRWQWAVSQAILAMLYHEAGRYLDARSGFERAIAALRATSNTWFTGVATMWLGLLEMDEDRLPEARARLEEARDLLLQVRDQWFSHANTGYRGILAHLEGNLDEAERLLGEAVSRATEACDAYRSALFLPHLGAVWARRRATASATEAFARSEAIGRFVDNPNLPVVRDVLGITFGCDAAELDARAVAHAARFAASSDARLALLVARRARCGERASRAPERPAALVVGDASDSFVTREGARVDLRRRRSLRLVFACLVRARREAPGTELSTQDLLEAGWPGERILFEAGRQRVYVTLVELRKLGLAPWMVHHGRGYMLDPAANLVVEASQSG